MIRKKILLTKYRYDKNPSLAETSSVDLRMFISSTLLRNFYRKQSCRKTEIIHSLGSENSKEKAKANAREMSRSLKS